TIVLVVGLLFAAYAFYSFYLVANGGLRELAGHLLELAEGDLRHPPAQQWATDETAHLLQRLGDTYESLKELIRKVRHGARELHTASNEIASASTDLAARTEASAAALEQQASAMEQIGSTVGNTASTAQEASDFSSRNAQVADRAGDTIRQVVATMQDIHASSSKINDIIGVIDGIAFQTNILALNAAVEAARAGDAGRGFAVVAAEVRGLAQRSANAAKEIKSLISTSVDKIDGGTRIVQGAGAVMDEVVSNARQVNTLLAEIATSSREQATGVEQVGPSIQELDRSTQQNAALVEETTAAASALRAEADKLQEEIRSFRVA
ncbi:MAG: methyl-accepting chemotaxis protein, partial [Burkholderiaceae bacterium]